jgi:hypothetical protein
MKDLSIIIINYKTPEILDLCIKSLKATIVKISFEIIVVDVETDYKTEYFIRDSFPDIIFVPLEKNVGYSKSVNAGIKKMDPDGKYILVLNADIIAKPDAVDKMFSYMEKNPKTGVSGPQLLNFNNTFQNSYFRFYTPEVILYRRTAFKNLTRAKKALDNFLMKGSDPGLTQPVDWLMGSALFIRRSALKKVGPMDERFFMYFEDVDWCRRFWDNDFRVMYYPEVKMMHYHGKQSAGSNLYALIHIVSAIKYFWKYLGKEIPKTSEILNTK